MKKIITWIAVILATAFFTVIGTFIAEESLELLIAKINKSKAPIVGTWYCDWIVTKGSDKGKKITDTLIIYNKRGSKIFGNGLERSAGPYKLIGEDTTYSTTFIYHGERNSHKDRYGTVILNKPNDKKMKGVWHQLVENTDIIDGNC